MSEKIIWPRKIIHVDMDAFFAAIEQRDHPKLRGKPVIVGGSPESRGVVSTCSYEARKFGVRSAMASAQAKKLCPQGIFLKPNFSKYEEASRHVMSILRQHTSLVEQASLDEAYLDVSQHRLGLLDPVMIASMIKQSIHAVTHLTASAGVAPNMFLAKIASDMKKPDGLTVVYPSQVENFLKDLPVRKIPGVGPVTEKELQSIGIKTCTDLQEAGLEKLVRHFGKWGNALYERSLGKDDRQVEPVWESKQISAEVTFPQDTKNISFLKGKLKELAQRVFESLREDGRMGRTVTLKVKYFDFQSITRSVTLAHDPADAGDLYEIGAELLIAKTEASRKPVRLVGLGVSGLKTRSDQNKKPNHSPQMEFSF